MRQALLPTMFSQRKIQTWHIFAVIFPQGERWAHPPLASLGSQLSEEPYPHRGRQDAGGGRRQEKTLFAFLQQIWESLLERSASPCVGAE